MSRHEILRFSQQWVLRLWSSRMWICQQSGGTCYLYAVDTECMFLLVTVPLLSNCMESFPRRLDSWCQTLFHRSNLQPLCLMFVLDISCLFSVWWELPYVIILTTVVYITEYYETFLCYTFCSPGLDHVSDCWFPVNNILQWFTCDHQLRKPHDDTIE